MRILWLSPFLLHPTTRGGQIRSLGILSELHKRHDVRFVSLQLDGQEPGVARVAEYSSSARLVRHTLPDRRSLRFAARLAANLVSPLPLTVARDIHQQFAAVIGEEMSRRWHDAVVCDFVSSAVNVRRVEETVLFQHNVETLIWERLAAGNKNAVARRYLEVQSRRMRRFEAEQCRRARHVIAVSDADACRMRQWFGIEHVSVIPTGVNVDELAPPGSPAPGADMVFVGSLDWIPNIQGLRWFVAEVLPLIRQSVHGARLAIVGKNPGAPIQNLAGPEQGVSVHGDVPDIRPYLWGAKLAVVPLHAGGGTRLKIYEAMAAGTPQVSTRIGAEGLEVEDGGNILLADDAESFAGACSRLLRDHLLAARLRRCGLELVRERFGWTSVAGEFERILDRFARA